VLRSVWDRLAPSKEPKLAPINARAETLPTSCDAIVILVVADGFYDWRKNDGYALMGSADALLYCH
jgi:putative SOS response-associated peptidase YedK